MTWESALDALWGWLWSALEWIGNALLGLLDRYVGLDFIMQGIVFIVGGALLFVVLAWLHDRSPRREHKSIEEDTWTGGRS